MFSLRESISKNDKAKEKFTFLGVEYQAKDYSFDEIGAAKYKLFSIDLPFAMLVISFVMRTAVE